MDIYREFTVKLRAEMDAYEQRYLERKARQLEIMKRMGSDDDSDWQYENALSNLEPSHARED